MEMGIPLVALLFAAPMAAVWWVIRHPAVRDEGPPRIPPKYNPMPEQSLDADDVWLLDTYGLNFTQRSLVRFAVGMGQVVDPDDLRPIAVAYVLRLQKDPRYGPRQSLAVWLANPLVGAAASGGPAFFLGVRSFGHLVLLAGAGAGGMSILMLVSLPFLRRHLERAARVNAEAPPGPGPDHFSRIRSPGSNWG